MKALATQFDNRRLSSAVATPTCSSCCCCCCCLATSIASSSLLAQRINREAKVKNVPNRGLLVTAGALYIPIIALVSYLLAYTLSVFRYANETIVYAGFVGGLISSLFVPACIMVGILWFLYSKVAIQNPLKRAFLVTLLVGVSFVIEFVGGAALILFTAGVGAIAYLVLIPFIVGWISVWYHRHIGKEVVIAETAPTTYGAPQPVTQQTMEQHEGSPKPPEPPVENSSTTSTQ